MSRGTFSATLVDCEGRSDESVANGSFACARLDEMPPPL
jgi:hypothetical protein